MRGEGPAGVRTRRCTHAAGRPTPRRSRGSGRTVVQMKNKLGVSNRGRDRVTKLGTGIVALYVAVGSVAWAGSTSRGTPARGSLEGGVSLPVSGDGFESYSRFGNELGRQYVHSRVRDALLEAFAVLHNARSDRLFVVGETGFRSGGRFSPHRSHQNGLSVDIFMPVVDGSKRSVAMPTPAWRKFGYALEFDASGQGEGLSIDFPSLAELLVELDLAAGRHGLAVERIIVAPEYVDRILVAGGPPLVSLSARFMRKAAWVRHDEHVHVDFRVEDRGR